MPDCPFCAIESSTHVDKFYVPGFIAFYDQRPQQRTHIIVASKEHIASFAAAQDHPDSAILGERFVRAVWQATKVSGLTKYRTIINNGFGEIQHMHAHIISRERVAR